MQKMVLLLLLSVSSAGLYAQNVGVATQYPNNGRLVIKSPSTLSGIVVGDSTQGVSIETSSPLVGFNNYYRSGRKFMAGGYSGSLQFITGTGQLSFMITDTSGAQGMTATPQTKMVLNKDGEIGLGISNPSAGLHVRGKNLLVDNASGFSDIILTPNTTSLGGVIELHNNTGIRTAALRAGDGSGISGELIFYDNTGTASSLELDGDYAATGRSRIIVDELQIKGGADFAEYFDVNETAGTKPEAGMLVCIDEKQEGKLVVSNTAYDKKVAGVISGANGIKPGMMMGHKNTIANGEVPVAITGRVYVKAEAFSSAIEPGDLLTTSATAGHAMKAANTKKATGSIIGKAMTGLQKGKQGMVLVLLSIQ